MFLCHPVRKLLVSINQSSYLIYPAYLSAHLNSKETNLYEITLRGRRSQILLFYFSSFIFKENNALIEEDSSSKNFDSQKEELDVIDDIDDIGNLEDLLRTVIIHEECGNLNPNLGGLFRSSFGVWG